MTALIPIFIKALPYLVTAAQEIPQIVTFISEVGAVFKRTKVWTPAQEAVFEQETADMRKDPAWQTD